MKIVNNTNLDYRQIGTIIDMLMNEYQGSTFYYGKVEKCVVENHKVKIEVTIRYLKKYVEWRFKYAKN